MHQCLVPQDSLDAENEDIQTDSLECAAREIQVLSIWRSTVAVLIEEESVVDTRMVGPHYWDGPEEVMAGDSGGI